MATATAERETKSEVTTVTIQPITYEVTKAEIAKVVEGAMMLRVLDPNDKAGLERCHKTRMQLRGMRGVIEKGRKAYKAEVLERGRFIDSTAKELIDPIETAEAHLQEQENIVVREQERIAREAEETRQKMIRARLEMLSQLSFPGAQVYTVADVDLRDPKDWESLLWNAREAKVKYAEAEALRKLEAERIAEANRVEAERLAKERAELEAARKQQEAAAAEAKRVEDARLAAERAELDRQRKEQEQFDRDRAAAEAKLYSDRVNELARYVIPGEHQDLPTNISTSEFYAILDRAKERRASYDTLQAEHRKRAEIEAAERARIEAEQKAERDAAAAKAKAEADEREAKRLEALRPDHEKLLAVADAIQAIVVPEVSPEAEPIRQQIVDSIRYAANDVRGFAGELVRRG